MTKTAQAESIIPKAPDRAEAQKVIGPIIKVSSTFVVKDQKDYDRAWEGVKKIDEFVAFWTQRTAKLIQWLHMAHKEAVGLRDEFIKPALAAKSRLLYLRLEWKDEQDRIARKKAQEDADREAEQQKKELEKTAKKLEKQGEHDAAAEVRELAATAPPPAPAPAETIEKTEGSVTRGDWIVELIEGQEHLVPREFCVPSLSLLRAHVKIHENRKPVPGATITFKKKEFSRSTAATEKSMF